MIGAETSRDAERLDEFAQLLHWVPVARVFVVVRDLLHCGVGLRVLELEPWHEHAAASVSGDCKRDRAFGRNEEEAREVVDVLRVEEHGAVEASFGQRRRE